MTVLERMTDTPATTKTLLSVADLAIDVSTRNGAVRVVKSLSLELADGEALGVVGESGCGKSITVLGLTGLLPHAARVAGGTAMFDGHDLLQMSERELRGVRGAQIGFAFQDPMSSLNPVMTIGAQLMEPLEVHRGMNHAAAAARAEEMLRLVGIPAASDRMRSYPHELSGGMRQRVMIAMALACEPQLLIADEPTTALDVTIQAQIVDLVKEFRGRFGMALIWITHDLALVSSIVDRIVVLYAGRIVEEAATVDIYEHALHHYTRALLGSLPKLEGELQDRLPAIPGAPPEPGRWPKGCVFAPRCALCVERCLVEEPPLAAEAAGSRHRAACWVTNPALSAS